jgi:CDP-6-deoxy-D-xylo-4-hexulose-3-dehydrase
MRSKNFSHSLMENNITRSDLKCLISFLKKNPVLTQSHKVKQFEKLWSRWLGVKYSVFVNSGSSANFLTIKSLKYFGPTKKEIIVPSLTWVSDIVAVIENGFKPVFVDIDLKNLSMCEKDLLGKITKKTEAVFITHAQGFNGLSSKILKTLKKNKIKLIEDVCESHGAKFKNKKLGTFGLASNFSFYYAHHMSTIEGGMICTNNRKIYEICRMLRGHGLNREADSNVFKNSVIKKYKNLHKEFIFLYPGFNMRSNEICAVLGINQLKRLDNNNKERSNNLKFFLNNLDKNLYYTNFDLNGSCNYALPLILKQKKKILRNFLEKTMSRNNIEFRRGNAGGGNQMRQPYLKKFVKKENLKNYPNVEHVHDYGYYIGNYPDLSFKKIKKITKILNNVK